jgi:hypothetical protein
VTRCETHPYRRFATMIRLGTVPTPHQKGRNVEDRQRETPIFTPILPWGLLCNGSHSGHRRRPLNDHVRAESSLHTCGGEPLRIGSPAALRLSILAAPNVDPMHILMLLDPPQDSCKNLPQLLDALIRTRAYDRHPHAPACSCMLLFGFHRVK